MALKKCEKPGLVLPKETPIGDIRIQDAPWRQATPDEITRFQFLQARQRRGIQPSYVDKPQTIPDNPTAPSGNVFLFKSPVHLLAAVLPEIKLYPWQREELLRAAGFRGGLVNEHFREPTEHEPFRATYPAANGSGKDFVLIAATAVWTAMRFPKTRVVITSASWTQLEKQTEPHIVNIINAINRKFGTTFKSVRFKHHCPITGSIIDVVLSDEPGMIEGYHPWPGGKLMIILNECKSISDEIHAAWRRCNGFSWWIQVSSPGAKEGFFYRDTLGENIVNYPEVHTYPNMYHRVITAFDCPHLPKFYLDECIRDMPQWWVDSSIYAKFFSLESDFVITEEMLLELDKAKIPIVGNDIGIGLDSSGGGDETSTYIRKGNKVIADKHFRIKDTTIAEELINDFLYSSLKEQPPNYKFFADDGGISQAFVDRLVRKSWHVSRIHNQAAAEESELYVNIGAEQYFHLKKLITGKLIHVPRDLILRKQLTSRRYDQIRSGKLRLEQKKDHRARTRESPDRADAFVLAFASLNRRIEKLIADANKPRQNFDLERFRYEYEWRGRYIEQPLQRGILL